MKNESLAFWRRALLGAVFLGAAGDLYAACAEPDPNVFTCLNETDYVNKLAALGIGSFSEGFENATVWGDVRTPSSAPSVTSQKIVWTANHPLPNAITTGSGGARTGGYGIFDPLHGSATGSTAQCDIDNPPEHCLFYDGFTGTRTAGASLLYGVGGYIRGDFSANVEIRAGLNRYTLGKLPDTSHHFFGVIDTAGFSEFQVREIDGKIGQKLIVFGDDFTFGGDNSAGNTAPVAVDDTVTVAKDTALTIDVLANDSDADGDSLSVGSVTQGANGSVAIVGTQVSYTPATGFTGPDNFTYTAIDGNGGSDSATVFVTVEAVNRDPVAVDDFSTTIENAPVTIPVLANDSDPDGDTLSIDSVTQGFDGSVVIVGNEVRYTPDPDFTGIDDFEYTVVDGNGGSATAFVEVTVNTIFSELGAARNYSVLGLGDPTASNSPGVGLVSLGSSLVTGDVGVGPYGTLDFAGAATIDGDLYLDPLIQGSVETGTLTGARIFQDLSGEIGDALYAADFYALLAPDPGQTFGLIDTSTVIYGNGGLNVIEIAAIQLSGSESLRFVGGPTDVYIVNVAGEFDLMNQAWVSSVPPGKLLFNISASAGSTPVTTSTGSVVNATLLAQQRDLLLQGRSGPVIGGEQAEIRLNSGGQVRAAPFPVFPEPRDHTGDGKADLVLRINSSGRLFMWQMDGNLKTWFDIGALPLDRAVAGVGDLTGDGKGDIVLRRVDTGYVFMWEMDGNLKTWHGIGPLAGNREIAGIGDLTGDGMADIVLRRLDSGYVYMWEMNGNLKTWHDIGPLPLDREVVGVADLTGDGKADIVLRNTTTGRLFMWEMDGNQKTWFDIGPLALDREVAGIGDLTGDGKADIVLRRTDTGYVYMWEMDANRFTYHPIGALDRGKQIIGVADLSGDDKADVVLRKLDTGFVFMWEMDGNLRTYKGIAPLDLGKTIVSP